MATFTGLAFPFRRGATSVPDVATDADLVKMSIQQIIMTMQGERVMRPDVGSSVYRFVFDNNDTTMYHILKIEIRSALAKFEPRVRVEDVSIVPDPVSDTQVIVTITYLVILTQTRDALQISLATQ
jgi:phage baseplate assembly protein W